ncbi:MAG: hypothetical protein KAT06_04555 [Gammaproteobacteria bacterium]|nr:hypothetical protein [Gammaproteobacteria bacterium]
MKEWFYENLYVFALSKRTQWVIIFGAIGYFAIGIWANYQLSNFELSGTFKPMEEVLKETFFRRYDRISLGFLIACFFLRLKLSGKIKRSFLIRCKKYKQY